MYARGADGKSATEPTGSMAASRARRLVYSARVTPGVTSFGLTRCGWVPAVGWAMARVDCARDQPLPTARAARPAGSRRAHGRPSPPMRRGTRKRRRKERKRSRSTPMRRRREKREWTDRQTETRLFDSQLVLNVRTDR
eukprot:scaffold159657_cov33-Tisochrysis_lutea.AAC.2